MNIGGVASLFASKTAPQAGKTRLRLTVLRTRRAAIQDGAPRRWPAPRFTRRSIGLLRLVSEANERRTSSVGE
jgi:hypothetical protein